MFIFMNKIVEQLGKPEEIVPELQALARRHLAYHATKDDYHSMLASLQWLLSHYLGGQITDEIKSAWSATYEAVCAVMQHAADEYIAANGGKENFLITNGKQLQAEERKSIASGSEGSEEGDADMELLELTPEELVLVRETWPHIRTITDTNGNEFDLLRIHVKEKYPEKKKYFQCPELKKLYEKQQRDKSAASFLAQLGHACEQIAQQPPAWPALQDHFARIGKSHAGSRASLPEVQEFGKVVMLMINEALGNLYTHQASEAWDKLVRMVLEWFVMGASEKRKNFFSPLLKRSNSTQDRVGAAMLKDSGSGSSVPTQKRGNSNRS
jgi:hemoglobin-like flavoprotein